jgi:rod shape-determining protein MreD
MTKKIGPAPAPDWSGKRMRMVYLAAILLAVAVFAQATLVTRLRFFGASPNLVLIGLLSWSLLQGPQSAVLWAFIGGLVFDLIAGLPLGTSSLALMLVCALAVLGEGSFFQGHVFLPMIAVAVATPMYAWLILLTEQLRNVPVDWAGATLRVVIPELLLNVALISMVYPAMRWLIQRTGGDRLEW